MTGKRQSSHACECEVRVQKGRKNSFYLISASVRSIKNLRTKKGTKWMLQNMDHFKTWATSLCAALMHNHHHVLLWVIQLINPLHVEINTAWKKALWSCWNLPPFSQCVAGFLISGCGEHMCCFCRTPKWRSQVSFNKIETRRRKKMV